jgi:hypothetical protein
MNEDDVIPFVPMSPEPKQGEGDFIPFKETPQIGLPEAIGRGVRSGFFLNQAPQVAALAEHAGPRFHKHTVSQASPAIPVGTWVRHRVSGHVGVVESYGLRPDTFLLRLPGYHRWVPASEFVVIPSPEKAS